MLSWKVLQKAAEAKDFNFLAAKLFKGLMEVGWSDDDIANFAERLLKQRR